MGLGGYLDTIMPFIIRKRHDSRLQLNKMASIENDLFKRNILLQLPRVYVECMDYFFKLIPQVTSPERITFHMEHQPSVFMNIMIAHYAEHGAKIYEYQSGGFVGETTLSIDPVRYAVIDKHRTYGWKIHEKDEPFYAVRLESFRREYEKSCSRVTKSQYDIIAVYNQVNSVKTEEWYTAVSQTFFQGIDRQKYPRILLRPRGKSRKFNNRKELAFLNPPKDILVDKGMKSMATLTAQSRLIVHWDHPSTNLLECIYVGHPVVAVLTNEFPTELVRPFYDFFLGVGVMHSSADGLIEHLNKVNIDEWWDEVIKMDMYERFKMLFTRKLI